MTDLHTAVKLALEALEKAVIAFGPGLTLQERAITALRQALANEALDKMAENAREIGLDYEPAQQEPVATCPQDIIHAITLYGDARADQDANNAPTTGHERLADCIRLVRKALAEQPAQQEQGDSVCQEDDGCPTELAVLQRFWRGQSIPYEHYPTWCKPAPVPEAHEQEPVAWMSKHTDGSVDFAQTPAGIYPDTAYSIEPLYIRPQTREPLNLAIIRKWPDGFQDRLQHVWLDVVSFIPNVKLYDLQLVLAEYGFEMQVYEAAHGIGEKK